MSHTWKLLPLAVFAALGAFMLLPGSNMITPAVDSASAAIDCDTGYRLRVDIIDDDTGDQIKLAGTEITIDPDPQDGSGSRTFTDNGSNDDNDDVGRIQQDDACEVTDPEEYVITLDTDTLPSAYGDCDLEDNEITLDELTANTTVEFTLTNCDVSLTPTATATTTVGPAATIVISSSNNNLGCGATSIVTITVRGANGQPVAAGTIVNIVADKGSVSPASGVTTADGSVFVFYTAPSNSGGEATITAASGSALGTTDIDINCNIAPTQPPPPTAAVGGIQPPNTGDGGLSDSNNGWTTYASVALILSSVIATLAVVRPRA